MSIDVANSWLIIFANFHLYNAALIGTESSWTWPDMEYVIELHGPEHLFVGGRPTDLEQCGPKMDLAGGIAQIRTSRHRSAHEVHNKQRTLRSDALICHLMAPRYWMKDIKSRCREVADASLTAGEILIAVHRRLEQNQQLTTPGDHELYLIPSLDQVRVVVDDEWRHLQFDYLGLQQRCFKLLERLRDSVAPALQGTVNMLLETGEQKQDRLESLPMRIVDSLSMAAANSNEANMRIARMAGYAQSALPIVKEFAEEIGAEGTTQALEALVRNIELMPKPERDQTFVKNLVEDSGKRNADTTSLAKRTRKNRNKNKNRKAHSKEQNTEVSNSTMVSTSSTLTMATLAAALPELARTGLEDYTYNGVDEMSRTAMRAMGITNR